VLSSVEGAPESVSVGRYVMPGGVLSRDPLGQPRSIKCNVDMTFYAFGPAVAVWVPGGPHGKVITPAAWMSLSGRRQTHPDRNTRGWFDANGKRHWLDVWPNITAAPARVDTARPH
jgi:hypothetical protein